MEELITQLARQIQGKYYGKYRGFVVDNADPEKLGRLRLKVPGVLGEAESGWALPCMPFGGLTDQGMFTVPEIDAQVWVEFEAGDPNQPIWTGTYWRVPDDVPEEAKLEEPTTRLLKTTSGHLLQFDDKEDEERIFLKHPKDATLEIDKNGTITLTAADGATLVMDADAGKITVEDANGNSTVMDSSGTVIEDAGGNKVAMTASGMNLEAQKIVVKGAQVMLGGDGGEPIIKGQSFLTLFATHVHPTGVGPSGPPVPQGEMSTLSTKVMTS